MTKLDLEECSCTETTDCARCDRLQRLGYRFIELNGEAGVGLLAGENDRLRDALREFTEAARRAIRLLPHPTSEEASTLEMEIGARGHLTQALHRLDNPEKWP